jgi:hypothetical protein
MVEGQEEMAIAAIWVTDRIDCCRVGFLHYHMVFHVARFDEALVQVTKVLSLDPGHCDTVQHCLYQHYNG